MPYANGSATTSTDLLQQLVTFLVANGWTQDASTAEGLGWRAHLHKSGNYVHLRARESEFAFQQHTGSDHQYGVDLYLGTAYSSGQPWNNQTTGAPVGSGASYPVGASMITSAGPFTNYYFMTDAAADNVVVIVERTPGLFVHLGWGLSIQAAGAITGGAYFFGSTIGFFANTANLSVFGTDPGTNVTASCPGAVTATAFGGLDGGACYVRVDVDSFTSKWVLIGSDTTAAHGYTGKTGASSVSSSTATYPVYNANSTATDWDVIQTSMQDGRANLLPVLLWVNRDGSASGYSLLGSLPIVFFSNGVGNGFSNASEYTIGADTYKMFPNFAVLKVP